MSATPADELVAVGLGSCIGVAIVDRTAGVAGLAHIVLPESGGRCDEPGKYADTAVPELISRLRGAGAAPRRLEAVIVGGARMFQTSGGLDIGGRNEQAVREHLGRARVPIRAARTGGSQGRTLRLEVGGAVSVRVAGEQPVTLLECSRRGAGERPAGARHRAAGAAHMALAVCEGVGL